MNQAALIALVIANLIIAGVALLQDWGYYALLITYWWEAVIIGAFNLCRVFVVFVLGDPFGPRVGFSGMGTRIVFGLVVAWFFIAKFGSFALMVGFFILGAPAMLAADESRPGKVIVDALSDVAPGVAVTVAALVISHGISFAANYLGRREYLNGGVLRLLFWPYARMGLTAVVLLLGLVSVLFFDGLSDNAAFVVALVAAKLLGDLWTHRFEHRKAQRSAAATS